MHDIDAGHYVRQDYRTALDKRNELWIEEEEAAYKRERNRFNRPTGWSARLFSHFLGALPRDAQIISATKENLSRVKSYRLAAFITAAGAVMTLIALHYVAPYLFTSPYQLLSNFVKSLVGDIAGTIVSLIILLVLLITIAPRIQSSGEGKFLDRSAITEELWFRMGAESWTPNQRFASCVNFGLVHVLTIFYPFAVLIILPFVGGIFMKVYLQEYKRSGDTTLATLASAKMHATFNRFIFTYILVAGVISLSFLFFD